MLAIDYRVFVIQLRAWGPAAAWAAVLFLFSSMSGWPGGDGLFDDLPDAVVHAMVYAVLGATLAHGRFYGARGVPHAIMILIGAAYGATDEWHQSFTPGRVPAVDDWFADVAGVVLGYGGAWLLAQAVLRRRAGETTETAR